ncbi:E3 ubiquitin ligase BIG BROTHER-related-like [Olea europaea subsp. europaea]|uniref:RING-type E3 ubiquitin transferase n=1 Tax=Olea europaea subsp. europaea TaxID=158383 RepID=A0A8S0RM57_OLEEU|nr:E3 ubiquitin ligase BIG BROTHER-related-like [Olea europaea subsp. europaea]
MAYNFQNQPIRPVYFTLNFTYFSGYITVMQENYWVESQGSNYQFPSTYGHVPRRRRSREHFQENYRHLNRTWQGSYDEVEVWDESEFIEHRRSNLSTTISRDDRLRTNFSQETILRHLKTRKFATSEEVKPTNEGPEICVVCQCEYGDNESIGRLRCGHEYHVDCITRWLCQKNVCPICKATAIPRSEEVARV